MATVGMVVHTTRPEAVDLARRAARWLEERGHQVKVPAADADATGLSAWACEEDRLADDLDLALSLGGDGTMLRSVDLLAGSDVPVLGVNVGHLGYLTEVEPVALEDALDDALKGDVSIEQRMTLHVTVEGGEGPVSKVALNEAVLERTASGHTVRLAVDVNGRFFTTYVADAMIVATPTGSTAYNLSARGPIVSPRHRALLLTPVAPHMLFDRTLVLDAGETIRLTVMGERDVTLTVDGTQLGVLRAGTSVTCTAGPHDARLVTFGRRDFHQILKTKFGLADR